jgi:hypothetical protein
VADGWNPAAVSRKENNRLGLTVREDGNAASGGDSEWVSPYTWRSLVVALGR